MKPPAAAHSPASASPSSSRPASSGLKTNGPRIAPNTAPNSTSAMPCARRSGGYMSPAAVRASSAVPLAVPTSTSPPSTAGAEGSALPSAASAQPPTPMPKPAASTGTRPKRSIARPAGSAASAPDASTIAGPSPSRPLTPTTATSVSEATAADSWSIPELAASAAASSAVLRRIGRSAARGHDAQRLPAVLGTSRSWSTTPPARGLRPIDPTPFRLRLERTAPRRRREPVGLDGVLADLDRRIRPFGAGFGAPWAARRAHGLRGGFRWDGEDSRTKAWYPQGIAASADGGVVLVSWYHKASNAARVSCVDLERGGYRHVPLDHRRGQGRSAPTRAGWPGARTCST